MRIYLFIDNFIKDFSRLLCIYFSCQKVSPPQESNPSAITLSGLALKTNFLFFWRNFSIHFFKEIRHSNFHFKCFYIENKFISKFFLLILSKQRVLFEIYLIINNFYIKKSSRQKLSLCRKTIEFLLDHPDR